MDLGLAGKSALVCASSRGLGRGVAMALAEAGVNLTLNARTPGPLDETAQFLRSRYNVAITSVAADITTQAGRAQVLAAAGSVDILVTNAGGPPPGLWSDWSHDDFLRALEANLLTPIALMQALLPAMIDRGWGRVINITSQSVKAPIAQLGLSNTARSGLTGFVAGTARQVAPFGVTINKVLPGAHATDRITQLDAATAKAEGASAEAVTARKMAAIPAGRYGDAVDFGAICAFLCSDQAKFMVGQNILVDGGAINATL